MLFPESKHLKNPTIILFNLISVFVISLFLNLSFIESCVAHVPDSYNEQLNTKSIENNLNFIRMKVMEKIIILLITIKMIKLDDLQNESVENCRERNRLITSQKGDLYALVDATVGEKLVMQCHYCDEMDDTRPKIWYTVDVFAVSEPKEVEVTTRNDMSNNRIQLTSEHSLIILNFTKNDTGRYFCIGVEELDTVDKINYLVDEVEKMNTSNIEEGNLTDWLKYHEDNMFPSNFLFKNSLSPEYVYIREKLKLALELKTEWDPWGPCEVCGRSKGIKTRRGRCRIKIEQIQKSEDNKLFTTDENFLVKAFQVSCRSATMKRLVPTIFNSTKIVPDFTQTQECDGICNPDALGENAGWKTGKTKSFKYRKTVVMAEGDYLTLICPELTKILPKRGRPSTSIDSPEPLQNQQNYTRPLKEAKYDGYNHFPLVDAKKNRILDVKWILSSIDTEIIWKKNGKLLKKGESVKPEKKNEEPRILVDTFSTLYLVEVKSTEEGNYTCIVDGIQMQQCLSGIYMIYLGFVMSLTFPCYIGGLIIACRRRYLFKTYEMLRDEAGELGREENTDEDE